jgi:hypothetical protein
MLVEILRKESRERRSFGLMAKRTQERPLGDPKI